MKRCSLCEETKAFSEFALRPREADGHSYTCKSCVEKVRQASKLGMELKGPRAISAELLELGLQRCSRCREIKPLEAFHSSKNRKAGVTNNCKPCHRNFLRERRAADPDRTTDLDIAARNRRRLERPEEYLAHRLKMRVQRHNITVQQYEVLLDAQGHLCALCLSGFGEKSPHIDHDHACCPGPRSECGKCVRALLCNSCNTGLGAFKDDQRLLKLAIRYLQETSVAS